MPCRKLGGGLGPGTDLTSRNNLTDIRPTDCHQRTRRRSWRVIFGSGCPESREKRAKPPDDFGRERPAGVGKLTGERFHLSVFGTRTIGKMKVVGLKEKSLKSLCGIELLGCLNVYQILMVGPNQEWFFCPKKPVLPLLQGPLDGQQLLVPDAILVDQRNLIENGLRSGRSVGNFLLLGMRQQYRQLGLQPRI